MVNVVGRVVGIIIIINVIVGVVCRVLLARLFSIAGGSLPLAQRFGHCRVQFCDKWLQG